MVDKRNKVIKALISPTGKLPADDTVLFEKIVSSIIETYNLTAPADQMAANQMAKLIMTISHCEKLVAEKGLFFEFGERDLTINPIAKFKRELESDFRSYIRLLRAKENKDKSGGSGAAKNFSEWIEMAGDGKNGKGKKKKK